MNLTKADLQRIRDSLDEGLQFERIDKNCSSYFEDYSESGCETYEYGFRSIAELKKLLAQKQYFKNNELDRVLSTIILRCKPDAIQLESIAKEKDVVDYIYQF